MEIPVGETDQLATLEMPFDKDLFLRTLVRQLADTLEDVVGREDAATFVSMVGQSIGNQMDSDYRAQLGVDRLSRAQVAAAFVDLKRRIDGDFYIEGESDSVIELGNRRCPFGDRVVGQPAMCMMTSNVFGVIAAQNLGYGRVAIEESIAKGAQGCKVRVYLQPPEEPAPAHEREYFRA